MNDPQTRRRYLLGTASDEERDALEEGYFGSDVALAAMENDEDALVEAYLDGTLAADERAAFEHHYLASPVRQRRVQVARGLRRAASPDHASAPWSGLGLAAAAILAVTVSGLAWLASTRTPPPAEPPVAEAPTSSQPPPVVPVPTRPSPMVVALVVPSVAVRGAGGPPTALVPADPAVLALTLQRDPGLPAIAQPLVVVETIEGKEAWQGPGTSAEGVKVSIPSDRLSDGDYLAVLFETAEGRRAEQGQFYFRVRSVSRP